MVYLFLADGFEEIEAVATIDILRRAGLTVQTVGVTKTAVKGAHGMVIEADIGPSDIVKGNMTMLILPGGMPGAETLATNEIVQHMIAYAINKNVLIGAICAAPIALGRMNVLEGKRAVCFPGFENQLNGALVQKNAAVVIDGNIVTAKGPGAVFEFAYKLVELACGWKQADQLKSEMQYHEHSHSLT